MFEAKRASVDAHHPRISIRRQCDRLGLNRSSYYVGIPFSSQTPENLEIMERLDRQYTAVLTYGSRRMTAWLRREGYDVNRKRIQRLMQLMGLEGLAPKPGASNPHPEHAIYPYLLRSSSIDSPNQVWSTDITYLPMNSGFLYLMAVIDWHSRYFLSWGLSNTLDAVFCIEALREALA